MTPEHVRLVQANPSAELEKRSEIGSGLPLDFGQGWTGADPVATEREPDPGPNPDARLRIEVLGELRVSRGGREVVLPPSKKTRALLAYLAVAARAQRRERLCDMFWDVPDDPRGSLRWSLSKLRSIANAGRERLFADRNSVHFRIEESELDLSLLEAQTQNGIESLGTEQLEHVASLFRGSFLEDLQLPRCPEFEAWRASYVDKLEMLRLKVLRMLVDRLRDEPQRALAYLNTLRSMNPEDRILTEEAQGLAAAARRTVGVASTAPRPPNPIPTTRTELASTGSAGADVATGSALHRSESPKEVQEIRFCKAPDGTRIAYATSGCGPPLLRAAHWLSHLQYDWHSPVWRHWIEALSQHNTLVRYDERGNGLSDWDVDDLSFDAMVADLESVADTAGLDRFALLGISQSCAISVAYAVRHPERVSGLILYGGYVQGWRRRSNESEIAVREALATLMREGWGQSNPIFRQLFTSRFIPQANAEQMAWFDELQRRTVSPENAWRLQNAFADIDVSDLLSQVRVPTLVLHARDDAVAPLESGRALAAGIPHSRFVELDSSNHILLRDEPAFSLFVQEVRAFSDMLARKGTDIGPAPKPSVRTTMVPAGPATGNAAEPLCKTFDAAADQQHAASLQSSAGDAQPSPTPLPNKPSLAVLPFDNLSGDRDDEYLADGIVEDLISALSRVRSFFVIARNSTFTYKGRAVNVRQVSRELGVRYVLEGSVRRVGDRVRVTSQLVDATTGAHLWADHVDGKVADALDLQDHVTASVVGAVQPSIRAAEIERARCKSSDNLDAYDLVMRALPHVWSLDSESNEAATKLLANALDLDSTYPLALSLAAWCSGQKVVYNWSPDPETDKRATLEKARLAADLASDDPFVLTVLGAALTITREFPSARMMIEKALALDANSAWAWNRSGWLQTYLGDPRTAIVHFERAIRLSPFDPMVFNSHVGIGAAHFIAERYEDAVSWFEKASLANPKATWIHRLLAPAYAFVDRKEQAETSAMTLLASYPDLTASIASAAHAFSPEIRDRIEEGLRRAGLPA